MSMNLAKGGCWNGWSWRFLMWMRRLYFYWCNSGAFYLACNCFSCIYLLRLEWLYPALMVHFHRMPCFFSRALLFGLMYTNPEAPVTGALLALCWWGTLFCAANKTYTAKAPDYSGAFFLRVYTGWSVVEGAPQKWVIRNGVFSVCTLPILFDHGEGQQWFFFSDDVSFNPPPFCITIWEITLIDWTKLKIRTWKFRHGERELRGIALTGLFCWITDVHSQTLF